MTRLRTARPSWSTPKGCAALGGARRSASTCAFGSNGATTLARSARARLRRRTTDPATTRWFETRRIATERRRGAAGAAATRGRRRAASAIADPRIGGGVQDVGDEVADDDGDGAEDRDRQDHRVVAR